MDEQMNQAAPTPVASGPKVSSENFFDEKTIETVKWSAIGAAVSGVIQQAALMIGGGVFARAAFGMGWVSAIISGIIGGAIGGIILAKLFRYIQMINKKFFKGWFTTLFKLYFWPSVVFALLGALGGGGFMFSAFGGSFGMAWLFMLIGNVAGAYVYAMIMEKKLGSRYNSDLQA